MKFFLALVVGVIIGGALAYFLFVGAPRAGKLPGEAVRAPEAGGDPPGTVVVELDEQFFNTLLGSIQKLGNPTFQLGAADSNAPEERAQAGRGALFVKAQDGGCRNQVVIVPEGGGVRTGVRLADGRVLAPLAFNGSYNLLGNCMNFNGTAQANIGLRFAAPEQTLYGQLEVEGVNLEGFSPFLSGPVTAVVQNALNQRVNPLVLMRGEQLTLNIPVQATGGTVRAPARDVRSEVTGDALRLHITYDFGAAPGAAATPTAPPPG